MNIREIDNQTEWDAFVTALPNPHLLQSWEWGEFKRRVGWTPLRLAFEQAGQPVAAAAVLARRAGKIPLAVFYVPKGPVMDYADPERAGAVLAALEQAARKRGGLFLKVDPDVPADQPSGFAAALAARGWRPGQQIQFRGTLLLDVARPEDEILAAMKTKTRYNIRLAGRKGVSVRQGTAADLPAFYRMYEETSVRDGFIIRPFDYYRDAWQRFMDAGLAAPLIAEVAGAPVGAVLVYRYGARAYYLYGASRVVHREKMPNYLLQWEAIRWAKAQGCSVYDFWGAPDELPAEEGEAKPDPAPDQEQDQKKEPASGHHDPLAGVYRFKQGFNARYVRWIGAYDFPLSRAGYWAYTTVMPRVLDVWRKRRRAETAAAVET